MKTDCRPKGRPPKFNESRRPITVTLPDRTLQQLAAIHGDRARAIVKATAAMTHMLPGKKLPVEVVEAYPGEALIIVGPSRCLRLIPWLRLVEIAPSRFLLVIPTGTSTAALEVSVQDLLEHLPPAEDYERGLLAELLQLLRQRRRQQDVSKAEILLLRIGKPPPAKAKP